MTLIEVTRRNTLATQLSAVLAVAFAACSPDAAPSGTTTPGATVAGAPGGTITTPTAGAAGARPGVVPPATTAGRVAPPATSAGRGGSPVIGSGTAGGPAAVGGAGSVASTAGTMAPPAAGGGAAGGPAMPGGEAPPTSGDKPTLPAVMGECPTFMDGGSIMVAGHRRIQLVVGAAGKGGPLLFAWHGTGGTASGALRQIPAGVQREIVEAGGIIAAFNGSDSSGAEGDCSGTGAHNVADFKAADQIAACAVMNHGIDASRIYATGCSAGGLQSGCMAFERSSYLAAAAPNSGGIVGRRQWQDMSSPAIFTMHGSQSGDVVIVAFADTSRTMDMAAKDHGSFVVNCNHNGGHCAASGELHTAAWEFMKAHPYGTTAAKSPWASGIPAGVPDYCEIF
jgi:predicted esterase